MTTYVVTENTDGNRNNAADSYFAGCDGGAVLSEWGNTNMEVGDQAAGFIDNLLVGFTLPAAPSGESIVSATLHLRLTAAYLTGPFDNSIYRCLRDYVVAEADWDEYATGSFWQTTGARGALDRGSLLDTVSIGETLQYYSWDVSAAAIAAYGEAASELLLTMDDTSASPGGTRRYDLDGVDGQRPELVLVYAAAGPSFNSGPTVDQITQGGARIRATGDLP